MNQPVECRRVLPEYEDENGNRYVAYTITVESCISDENGVRLDHKLKEMNNKINELTDTLVESCNNIMNNSMGNLDTLPVPNSITDSFAYIIERINELQNQISELSAKIN